MYIIITGVIIGVVFMFYNTIINLLEKTKENKTLGKRDIMVWFYGLLIINIIVIISILLHKYYVEKYQLIGERGLSGYTGDIGRSGNDVCDK